MAAKEARARIKINQFLHEAGWRFFDEGKSPANIILEPGVKLTETRINALGEDFETANKGFIDFLLLDTHGKPLIVLEAKSEDKNPLVGKEQARKHARSQACRFVILSNGNLHYFWDLERGNPNIITSFPTPDSAMGYHKAQPNPQQLIEELVGSDNVVLIGFFKIENDGFGFGAQRRAIEKNELPLVKAEIEVFLGALRGRQSVNVLQPAYGLIVSKEEIAANGDYNLIGERYRENGTKAHIFPLVTIADVCAVNPRKSQMADLRPDTRVSFVPMADLNEYRISFEPSEERRLTDVAASYTYFQDNDVLLAKVTPCFENGKAGIARGLLNGIGFGSSEFYVLRCSNRVLPEWVYFCVMYPIFRDAAIAQMTGTGGLQRVPRDYVENFQIPLPPLEVQKEIAAEIEGYQKVITGARTVLDNYRPHIPIKPEWPTIELSEICSFKNGLNFTKASSGHAVKIIGVSDFKSNLYAPLAELDEVQLDEPLSEEYLVRERDLLFVRSNGNPDLVGRSIIVPQLLEPITFSGFTIRGRIHDERAIPIFYAHFFKSRDFAEMIKTVGQGANIRNLSQGILNELKIPLPPLAIQQAIVAEIEAEQALVAANREPIARFETKIQATLARVWGEDAPAMLEG